MRQGLGADCAYPPAPARWVADLQQMGCAVGFIYVYGPIVNYTPDHVAAAREAGIAVLPIIVPGDAPPPPPLYAAAWPYGVHDGPIFYDIEDDSLPPASWVQQAAALAADAGWRPGVYCTASRRAAYSSGLWWRAGTQWTGGGFAGALPAPAIDLSDFGTPAALQYDFEVTGPSGAKYDLSAVDLDQLLPPPPPAPAPAPVAVGPPAWAEEED